MLFEIRKILSNKAVIILFLLLLSVTFIYCSDLVGTFSYEGGFAYERNNEITEEFEGELTEEKYDRLQQLDDSSYAVLKLQRLAEYILRYDERCQTVINSAQRIKAENEQLTNADIYTNRLADKIIMQRQNREELLLGDYSALIYFVETQDRYSTYLSLLLVFICAIISAELFCGEMRTGVFKINFTSRNGRLGLYRNKILALMICSAFFAIIFTAVQLGTVLIKYGISQVNAPLQSYEAFSDCAYNIGFLQYIFAICAARILCCWFVCMLTVCFAVLFRNLIASAAVVVIFSSGLFLMLSSTLEYLCANWVISSKYQLNHDLMKFSPISLLNAHRYFVSTDYVNILDFPVTELFVNIALTSASIVFLTIIGGALFVRKRRHCQ